MCCWPDILEKEPMGWPREPEEPGKAARWSCRFCPCVGDMHGRKVVLEKSSTMGVSEKVLGSQSCLLEEFHISQEWVCLGILVFSH